MTSFGRKKGGKKDRKRKRKGKEDRKKARKDRDQGGAFGGYFYLDAGVSCTQVCEDRGSLCDGPALEDAASAQEKCDAVVTKLGLPSGDAGGSAEPVSTSETSGTGTDTTTDAGGSTEPAS